MSDRPPWYQSRLMVVAALIITLVLAQFMAEQKAVETSVAIGMLFAVIVVLRRYHRETWFWLAIATFAVLDASAISLISVRFPSGPAITYLIPVGLIDMMAMLVVLDLLATKLSKVNRSEE